LQAIRRAFYRRPSLAASLDLSKPPSVILLAGPTASGKSALALTMARETGGVIVNADSQQLYADLRILTARPSAEEEAMADHRLYGVADAAEAWSVGKWSRAVLDLLTELRDEGRPAILVGGTGLYFMALTRGLADIPPVPSSVRDTIQADYLQDGETAFRQRLAQIDPASASAIEHGDRQRLVRAMSVHAATGRTLSAWKAETQPLLTPSDWTGLVVEPDRARLYDNCDRRVDQMMDKGVLAEVRALMQRNLNPALPAMKAVGLRELAAHLSGETDRPTAVAALKQATRNYAKRQLTWFRNQTADWPRV
jgi:tRNA dimethylallyltransferase